MLAKEPEIDKTKKPFKKKTLYENLADKDSRISPDEENRNNLDSPNVVSDDYDHSEIEKLLRPHYAKVADSDSGKVDSPEELPFCDCDPSLIAAAQAHALQWDSKEDSSDVEIQLQNAQVLLHEQQVKLSRLDFERVADDLWATPNQGSDSFVIASLEAHMQHIEKEKDLLDSKVITTWKEYKESEIPEHCQKFVSEFKSNWSQPTTGERNKLQSPEPLVESVKIEKDKGSELVLSLRSKGSVILAKHSQENIWNIEDPAIEGPASGRFTVFHRGHTADLTIAEVPGDSKPFVLAMKSSYQKPQIAITRADSNEAIGEILFVIDCSYSMFGALGKHVPDGDRRGTRMYALKKGLTDFLDQTAERNDIKVSMFAIGASRQYIVRDEKIVPNTQLPNGGWVLLDWITSKSTNNDKYPSYRDVIKFDGKSEIISLESSKRFIEAVDALKPWGETPLVQGINAAFETRDKELNSLIVVLTDGFERILLSKEANKKRGGIRNDKIYDFDPDELLKEMKDVPGVEFVVFNFAFPELLENMGDPVKEVGKAFYPEPQGWTKEKIEKQNEEKAAIPVREIKRRIE